MGNKILDSWIGRHTLQFIVYAVVIGVAWGTSQAEIDDISKEQSETNAAVKQINEAVTSIRIDGATTKQKVETLEQQMKDLNRKIDTLLWRTAPNNPSSPYPQQ